MDIEQIIRDRSSIRAFKQDQVPHDVLEKILKLSICAPSAINLQPWELYVISGEEKDRLSRTILKAYKEKKISCGPSINKPLPKTISSRGAITLQQQKPFVDQMNVDFDTFINEGSCNFYGAPAVILLCIDDSFSKTHFIDIGVILGYIILIAHNYGLSTCPNGLITSYGDEIKDLLNIPQNKTVLLAVSVGYADMGKPVNLFKSPREDFNKLVTWIE
jgi:nitroreductase